MATRVRKDLFEAIRPFAPNQQFSQAQVRTIDNLADEFGLSNSDQPTLATRRLYASQAAYDLIKEFEGCQLRAYLCPAGIWTVGWGSTGYGIKEGVVWDQAQADSRLREDVERVYASGVRSLIGDTPTTQGQFDALVSFSYNLGLDALEGSTLLKKHMAGDYEGAADQFLRWNKARVNGRMTVLRGLTRRREIEKLLYTQ